jgi:predicted ATP-grasp superfamily ATP-dependent carboligase
MTRRLIILGASARAAAFSAIRAGFAPYAIDCFADRDLAAVCPAVKIERYPGDFPAALAAAPDAPWIYTGGLENHPRLIEQMAAVRPLWGNVGAGLRNVRKPARLAETARAVGLCFPRSQATLRPDDLPARWLVKRRRSSGGLGVTFATANDLTRPRRGSYFQEFIEGKSASALFVAARGRATLLGTTNQLLGRDVGLDDRPFLYAGSFAPLILADDDAAQLRSLGSLLAEGYGLTGLFGMDFVLAPDGLWLIEVNPRYTASVEVLERMTGENLLALHAAACEDGSIPDRPRPSPKTGIGKQIVYAGRSVVIPPEFDRLVAEWNPPNQSASISDVPRSGDRILAGQPIATVFASGTSSDGIRQKLHDHCARVLQVLSTKY